MPRAAPVVSVRKANFWNNWCSQSSVLCTGHSPKTRCKCDPYCVVSVKHKGSGGEIALCRRHAKLLVRALERFLARNE